MNLIRLTTLKLWILLGLVVVFSSVGCSDPRGQVFDKIRAANKTNAQKITSSYLIFQTLNDGKGPKSEEEFKQFCTSDEPYKKHFDRIGLDRTQFDKYLTASDGQPLVIIYGVGAVAGPNNRKPIVFDSSGDGVFSVGFTDSTVTEVDETEFESLKKAAMNEEKR